MFHHFGGQIILHDVLNIPVTICQTGVNKILCRPTLNQIRCSYMRDIIFTSKGPLICIIGKELHVLTQRKESFGFCWQCPRLHQGLQVSYFRKSKAQASLRTSPASGRNPSKRQLSYRPKKSKVT